MLAVLKATWEWHLTRAILASIHSDNAKSGSREFFFFLQCFQSYKFQSQWALNPSCVPHRNWKNALPHIGYHVQLLCSFPRTTVTKYTMRNGSKQDNFFLWWFWRLKVWNWCVGGPGPFTGSREESFHSSSSVWWLLVILDILWLIDVSLQSLLPSLHGLFLCVVVSLSKLPSVYEEAVMLGSGLALIYWPHFNLITSTKILFSNRIPLIMNLEGGGNYSNPNILSQVLTLEWLMINPSTSSMELSFNIICLVWSNQYCFP